MACVSAGISTICLYNTHDPDKPKHEHKGTVNMWHALAASTFGTNIRLRLRSDPATWQDDVIDSMRLLAAVSRPELVQRLMALDICVSDAQDTAAVHSLAALRHLRLSSDVGMAMDLFEPEPGVGPPPCQLYNLRSLQLHGICAEAFFTPGVDASLHQLRSLCLRDCHWDDAEADVRELPDELLRLASLERLELIGLVFFVPDMRGLPALRTLVLSAGAMMHADVAIEPGAPWTLLPFAGAAGLTQLTLDRIPVVKAEIADAIERLPHLKQLHLDFWRSEEAAYWAATLQRRLQGRCSFRPASGILIADWAGNNW